MWRQLALCVLLASVVIRPAAGGPTTAPVVPCDVSVDGRVELVCVLFRLAGNREYNRGRISSYERDIARQFEPFREHEAVKLAWRLARAERGAGYDAPMSLAVHLSPLPELAERVPFNPRPAGLDSRLAPEPTRAFVAAARRFAADAKFDEFMVAHREFYDVAVARMSETLAKHARLEWYEGYFGVAPHPADRPTRFHLILGLQNGPSNYGARVAAPDGDHLYSIIGAWEQDEQGLPRFGKPVVPTVIHEFGHSYVNPVVDRHLDVLRPAGEKIYARVADTMRAQAYAQWPTMMRESVLRACVVRYRLANEGPLAATAEIAEQTLRGFTWTAALSARLAEYESQRGRYPDFDAFMPRIVDFFDEYAASLK